jgi:drug/metabolite transporter (DMT)-like permease
MVLIFFTLNILSTHFVIRGLQLYKSRGDSFQLVYLNIIIGVLADVTTLGNQLNMQSIIGALVMCMGFLGCGILKTGCSPHT